MVTLRKCMKPGLPAAAAIALAVAFGTFGSDRASADNHEQRNEAMKAMGGALKAMGGAVANGDAAEAQKFAGRLSALAAQIPAMFEGGRVGTSRAKPEIWSNFADFAAKADALRAAADMVVADAGAGKLEGGATRAVGATCGACHQIYRGPRP